MADQPICSRLPQELVDALDADAAQQGIARAELIKAILTAYYFGDATALVGADKGYLQGRRLGVQLAYLVFKRAAELMPTEYEEAIETLRQEGLLGARGG